MRHSEIKRGKVLFAACGFVLLGAALLIPSTAPAWTTGSSWGGYRGGGYGYGGTNARYLQGQSQSAAVEARNEAAREKNRERIAKEKEEFTAGFLASQAEIRAASRAAMGAPQGYFYRAPGHTLNNLPESAVEIKVGETTFHYFKGIFFRQIPGRYIVVPAPFGAIVDELPDGHGPAVIDGDADTYKYYFGTFFAAEGDKWKVVQPTAGTLVGYVPDGYTETGAEESLRFQFGEISFQPYHWQNNVIFQVVKS